MHLVDYPDEHPPDSKGSEVAEQQFREHYLRPLRNEVRFVRLESGFGVKCWGYQLKSMLFDRNAQEKWSL